MFVDLSSTGYNSKENTSRGKVTTWTIVPKKAFVEAQVFHHTSSQKKSFIEDSEFVSCSI